MAWGQNDSSQKSEQKENLFIKVEDGQSVTVRITTDDAVKRTVHKIRSNNKITNYINCPGYAVCPICKLPKSAKDPKASYTIITQNRYFVPVLNRDTGKVGVLDIPKTPKEEIDLIAKQNGSPQNYDIVITRMGNNLKPQGSMSSQPITQAEIDLVVNARESVNTLITKCSAPETPENIRKILDEQHKDFIAQHVNPTATTTNSFAAPQAQAAAPQGNTFGQPAGAGVPNTFAQPKTAAAPAASPFAATQTAPANPMMPTAQKAPPFKAQGGTIDDQLFK